MANNLRQLREKAKLSQEVLAALMGTTRNQLAKLESGSRRLSDPWIARAAAALGVDPGQLVTDEAAAGVPIVGRVGAGAVWEAVEDGNPVYVDAPGVPPGAVATEIVGDSLGPIFDRWLAFYMDRHDPVTDRVIGRLCVVGTADGRTMIKEIRRGAKPGRFLLRSGTGAIEDDVELLWAAPVITLRPRLP